jgi:hypothetical protein
VSSVRIDRHHGWVTLGEQRFPERTPDEVVDCARRGLCPFCLCGPFTVVAMHVSKKHGIDRREFRDYCGFLYSESICDPTHSAVCRERWFRMQKSPTGGRKGRTNRMSQEGKRRATLKLHSWEAAASFQQIAERDAKIAQARSLPHPCSICGAIIPKGARLTCSEEHEAEARRRALDARRDPVTGRMSSSTQGAHVTEPRAQPPST